MPRVWFVRDEMGLEGQYYATKREAQEDFQWRCDNGEEPDAVLSHSYKPTRRGIAALLNMISVDRRAKRTPLAG